MFRRKKYSQLTDSDLVALNKLRTDNDAIGVLYERYGHLVFGLALQLLKNKNEAEDITSSVFEHLSTKIKKSEITHFKSWLYTVTKNECFMFFRKIKFTEELLDFHVQEDSEIENPLLEESQFELLFQELNNLKVDQKESIRLFYLENKSYQQISELLDLPISKVKSAIQNGKRNLKISLEQRHEFKNQ